ncbi:MAG: chromosome segregation protein SMC [Acidimicrobiaceae bacterium]|nr:chromosome segregation protein SMC [Acidimicrobiaceae bacterium]MYH43717.1 chromosome segregation protein SMC [Acidimicrobiaceae bacterium]MYI55295.1 chromosome segregation protein SMC [Acidimicrobiaceae bacterium]
MCRRTPAASAPDRRSSNRGRCGTPGGGCPDRAPHRTSVAPVYLKTLTLKGFKSFAEPASIRLEPGVTVVVGPNGSGKSNVVDAVAWVLGAQAPSAVRSARMDDVIFAGTAHKPPLGRAEVSLTIDNSDGMLPLAASEVEITRTLFRDGESTYGLNGTPCRLLDVVELLADTGVGRQQHMIVSQSQIDAVLNARPTDRRVMVEEAAGILKYRKRRERAERRLLATDGDLTRMSDLLREVRRRLRPLQKQAEAARRHADLLAELEVLRVQLAGREISDLRERLRAHKDEREALATRQADLRTELDALSARVAADEQRLARHGMDDHSERLARIEGLRARAAGLAAVAVERRRGIEHQRAALADHDLAAGLQGELERSRSELSAVVLSAGAADTDRLRLEEMKERLEADRAAFEARWGDRGGFGLDAAGEAAEARGEMAALQSTIGLDESERDRLAQRLEASERRLQDLAGQLDRRRREQEGHGNEITALRTELAAAETDRAEGESALEDAVEARSAAGSDLRHWAARSEALAMALDKSARPVPVDVRAAADGVLGLLGDLVEVDPGLEAAFAAAAGDAVGAVVVRRAAAARRVLDSVEASDAGAAVIALEGNGAGGAEAVPVDRLGLQPLRGRVRAADPDVARLLDVLLDSTVLVEGDWRAAADVWMRHPGAVVVTPVGDRLSSRGWRLGVHGAAGLRPALAEAEQRLAAARAVVEQAEAGCGLARSRLEESRGRVDELARRLAASELAAASSTGAVGRAESDQRDLRTAAGALRDHLAETSRRLEEAGSRVTEIESRLPELEAAEAQALQRNRQAGEARADLDRRASELAALMADQSATDAGLEQRQQMLGARVTELEERLAVHHASRVASARRLAVLERQATVLGTLRGAVEERTGILDAGLAEIREVRRRHSDGVRALAANLDGLRRRQADAENRYETLRQTESRHDIEEAELRTRLQTAVERLRDAYGLNPHEAASAQPPELPDGLDPGQRVDQLATELEIMGPVNPLALAEYDELYERHELLSGQLHDIRAARRDLNRVIRSIDGEIKAVFSSAFVDVAANFEVLFEALFPGGEGRLSLTDPDDLFDAGIEISAKPSGKNVKRLSLLSGGERTLAALAFLFAVFRSRPSPFYVMDEVEAALDDVNLHRFLTLIDEFRSDAQLVIVTHQKRTMEAADCLQGVSMKPGGSSMVVSERVSDAA